MAEISLVIRAKGFAEASKHIQKAGASAKQSGINLEKLQKKYSEKHIDSFVKSQIRANAAMEQTRGKTNAAVASAAVYRRKIEQLIKAGIDPQSKSMQRLVQQYNQLSKVQSKVAKKSAGFKDALSGAAMTLGGGAIMQKTMSSFFDFDTKVKQAGSIVLTSIEDQKRLEKGVLKAASNSIFTGAEASDATRLLMQSGLDIKKALIGLPGALQLAAAGYLSVADAAKISTNALNIYSKKTSDLPHINNMLAEAAKSGNTNILLLGESMAKVGNMAPMLGVELEQLLAMLTKMANAGLVGSEAGTLLRNALSRLAGPAEKAKKVFKAAGLSVAKFVDTSKGKFTDLSGYIEAMKKSIDAGKINILDVFEGLDERAARAVGSLLEVSKQQLDDLTQSIKNSKAAGLQAQRGFHGLSGALREFLSTSDAQMNLFFSDSSGIGLIEKMVRSASAAMKDFGPEISSVTVALGGLITAAGVFRIAMLAIGASAGPFFVLISAVGALAAAFGHLSKKAAELDGIRKNLENFKTKNNNTQIVDRLGLKKEREELLKIQELLSKLDASRQKVKENLKSRPALDTGNIFAEKSNKEREGLQAQLQEIKDKAAVLEKAREFLENNFTEKGKNRQPLMVDVQSPSHEAGLERYRSEINSMGITPKDIQAQTKDPAQESQAQIERAQKAFDAFMENKFTNQKAIEEAEQIHEDAIFNIKKIAAEKIQNLKKDQAQQQLEYAKGILNDTQTVFSNLQVVFKNMGKENRGFAVAQKAISMALAIINTAEAVTNALKVSALKAFTVGAAGAAQVAAIASTPIPSAQTGTPPDGYSNFMSPRSGTDNHVIRISEGEKVIPRGESAGPTQITVNLDKRTLFEIVQEGLDNREIIFNT